MTPLAQVGLAWDDACLEHDSGPGVQFPRAYEWLAVPHQESPERIQRCRDLLAASGRLDQLVALPQRMAGDDDLLLVHSAAHVERVRATQELTAVTAFGDFIAAGPRSWRSALASAGSTIEAVDAVLDGRVESAFALVRPPGHHASQEEAMGSCFFNNVAIAARHLQRRRGVERVAIVDWDVHHGNGTAEVFAEDPSVLFISLHEDDFYPRGSGRLDDRGRGDGFGATINVPLPPGTGDDGYAYAFERIVVPALRELDPEFVLVSAGQDPAATDPNGRMSVTAEGFRAMTVGVQSAADACCDGRLVLVQEGGYSPTHMPWCVLAIVEALLRVEPSFAEDPVAADGTIVLRPEERDAVDRVFALLGKAVG